MLNRSFAVIFVLVLAGEALASRDLSGELAADVSVPKQNAQNGLSSNHGDLTETNSNVNSDTLQVTHQRVCEVNGDTLSITSQHVSQKDGKLKILNLRSFIKLSRP